MLLNLKIEARKLVRQRGNARTIASDRRGRSTAAVRHKAVQCERVRMLSTHSIETGKTSMLLSSFLGRVR